MEMNLHSKSFENINNKNNFNNTKSKILYKFNIMDNNTMQHNYMGKCYLINFNNIKKKYLSLPKNNSKPEKLPLINLREYNPCLKTVTFRKNKDSFDYYKYKFTNNNQLKTIPTYSNFNKKNKSNISNISNNKYKSSVTLSESFNNIKNKTKNLEYYNNIINKINQKYFVKHSTIDYLNNLFFGNSENHDLKVIKLSKIKDNKKSYKKNLQIELNKNISKNNQIFDNKFRRKKINSYKDINSEKPFDRYKPNKSNLDELLKNFQNMKIKKCKILVDDVLKDLKKAKEKNLIYIENFKKSCDFQYEDF